MKITVKNKEYELGKMVRAKYKVYSDARNTLVDKEIFSDNDIDVMVKTLVKLYDNEFTEDDINEDMEVNDIIFNFTSVDFEIGKKINNKIEKAQAFMKDKR